MSCTEIAAKPAGPRSLSARDPGSRVTELKPLLRRAVRFGITGVFVTACHACYAVAAIELDGWTPPVANGYAFTFATLVSYLLNTRWSFSRPVCGRSFARFWMVCSLGLMQSIGVSWAVERAGLPYPVGIGLITLTVPPVSFVLHSLWTYRDSPAECLPDVPAPAPTIPQRNGTAGNGARRKRPRKYRRPYQRLSR
jgi:putative flippase GtrA